ncbi:MAG: Nif3-like dinuclear metal center hexameric protein [Candidatus Kapaibacterium sp.]
MKLKRILEIIEEKLPAQSAMEGDRIGLQVQSRLSEASSILVALEVDDSTIDEAISQNCNCIIAFHPLIFHPIKTITENDRTGRLVSRLIQNSISMIAVHTTFDAYSLGTSEIIAKRLGLESTGFLVPDPQIDNRGMGVVAAPEKPIAQSELLNRAYDVFSAPLRYSAYDDDRMIERVAIVGGSGGSFMNDALRSRSDAFITADITYHTFHAIKNKIMLIDPGHYEMEQFVPEGLAKYLAEDLKREGIEKMMTSTALTNPVSHYPEAEKYEDLQRNYLLNNKIMV